MASNRILGFLSLGHGVPNSFTQEHLRIAKSLAVAAAVAIQNARLYETAEIYASELERRVSDLRETREALEQSEEGRRASEERFKSVFRSSPIAFSITTLDDGRFVDVNEAFERRYGYSREEVLGRTTQELGIWENAREREKMVAEIQRGTSIRNAITRVRLKSGSVASTMYSAEAIHLDGIACLLIVSEDLPAI
jgi:PAS domain S-box-containing protein